MENIQISFPGLPTGQSNDEIESLKTFILNNYGVDSKRKKEELDTMDLGTVLEIFTVGALPTIAIGIAHYIERLQGKTVKIVYGDKSLEGKNLSSKDIENVLNKF
ncbi:hypothetical protein LZD49_18435 [Dyadobacter sp. CY261]|uniref:hypothetical protein n=1 Tax=Dyadobacter sp. CY261 TaxID=2907203 RepID=UPI001F223C80|nr:hypothetical protein [Dyadobacter sp. CY261]MCF0072466.1 hypothetical protein [Dyadobacter sp. CY261]